MEEALRAGVAVYNAGEYHAAHDAWEDRWLDLEQGTDDERFLHGLIQFTAAVHHARTRNWSGATGLAGSGADYLAGLPETYRGVNVGTARSYLHTLRVDPERIERADPPALRHRGRALSTADLDLGAMAVAAGIIAEEYGYDESVLARGVELAREEVEEAAGRARYLALVTDFVADAGNRGVVFQRLREHVERRERRDADVDGLFGERNDSDDAG